MSLWRGVSDADTQRMALVWESEELLALNKSIMAFIKDQACTLSSPALRCTPYDNIIVHFMHLAEVVVVENAPNEPLKPRVIVTRRLLRWQENGLLRSFWCTG